ncbi:hypothetical protein [Bradyrhizobium stylosanthis]|uniref:Uncharacterized protein n=1 Tax=Bradyrhizobium stylosanthis TaxID=1803665 RepID=A0A560CXI1_9BRAD|nr:hypothetical protein [Bradyrhizobium stylosanthis]TWA89560.1 hypothetical protein FBZ96_11928 [Bradyrhizobium stylosanthis]
MESYKHRFAKETLARWLADPEQDLVDFRNATGGGHFGGGVFMEYPFCVTANDELRGEESWHEIEERWDPDPPSYEECLRLNWRPLVIFDVALHHKGFISDAFEVVHKHDIHDDKLMWIHRIKHETGLRAVRGLSADWILNQVGRPSKLKTIWTI